MISPKDDVFVFDARDDFDEEDEDFGEKFLLFFFGFVGRLGISVRGSSPKKSDDCWRNIA